ncbi:MAG: 16S rRNA (guanine(966)-N(2))-methyltransferase RsmD, partial [Alphaproteobacteria bacterium]
MRVVGGRYRGTRLVTPRSSAIRPTSDRVREAVFNILEHGIPGFEIEG